MRLGKDSKSDSPNGNSASPASIACCDYYHPLLIASFVHIKLPPFPNCLRTCKSSLDVRTNHVQSQPTVTRAETGSLSAYLSGTESSLPSTPPFFFYGWGQITGGTCSKEGPPLKSVSGRTGTQASFTAWGSYQDTETETSVRCTRYPDPAPSHGDARASAELPEELKF